MWDARSLTESIDDAAQFNGSFLEIDLATADQLRELAELKGLRPQEVAREILRAGIENEELRAAASIGVHWDTLVQQGANYISEVHDFNARPGEPEDYHLLQHSNGNLLKAWTVVEEWKDGAWQKYRHGLGQQGAPKRQRHFCADITLEAAVRLIEQNAIPEFFQADFRRVASA